MRGLPSIVWAFGVVSLLTDLSSEMIYPLLPLFVTTVVGGTVIGLGLIEGVAEATAALTRIVSGKLADKIARPKRLVVAGYGLSSVARPLIGLAAGVPWIVVMRFLDRVGKGIRSAPRDALIAGAVEPEKRARAYGVHRAMDNAGAVLGPLVALGLMRYGGLSLGQIFLVAAVPGALAMLALTGVRSSTCTGASTSASTSTPTSSSTSSFSPELRRVLIGVGIFALGNASDTFLVLRLTELGATTEQVILLWAALSAVRVVATTYGGALADRFGKEKLLVIGWAYQAVIYAALAFADAPGTFAIVFALYGLAAGLIEPSERALVAALAPPDARGRAFGWFYTLVGLAALPASVACGLLWKSYGPTYALGLSAALALVAALVVAPLFLPSKRVSG